MKKIFEAINELVFNNDNQITHIISAGGEEVKLCDKIPHDEAIEVWCMSIEQKVKQTMQIALAECILDYKNRKRIVWICNGQHVSQALLITTRVMFTESTEKAIVEHDLALLFEHCHKSIDELIKLIRGELKQQLTPLMHKVVSPMVVQEVNQREVVTYLQKSKTTDLNAFEWVSKLRFYFMQDSEHW